MFTVTGQIEQEAAEANGAETIGDGKVIFFATAPPVEEDQGGIEFSADWW